MIKGPGFIGLNLNYFQEKNFFLKNLTSPAYFFQQNFRKLKNTSRKPLGLFKNLNLN